VNWEALGAIANLFAASDAFFDSSVHLKSDK